MRILIAMLLVLVAVPATAQGVVDVRSQWDTKTKLAVAQCLLSEAGFEGHNLERAAIAHVLVKRWMLWRARARVSLLHMVRRYCAVHHATAPTAKQQLTRRIRWDAPIPYPLCRGSLWVACNYAWAELQAFVERFAAGEVPDPYPMAVHFGSAEDHRKRVRRGLLGAVRLLPREVTDRATMSVVKIENYFYAQRGG